MEKIYFTCDYSEIAHPNIIKRMERDAFVQTGGYGEDAVCAAAAEKIRTACGKPEAAVHFLVGGTQANMIVIHSLLRPHQGVIAPATGHIEVHETGAVEGSGHKVLAVPSEQGKLKGDQIRQLCKAHWSDASFEHLAQPGMVYISFPTEYGTLYTRSELQDIKAACEEWHLPLFIDGARMGYGIMSEGNDMTLAELADLCDVFYIGGTKVGAMFGEAVVFTKPELAKDFRYIMKNRGGMLAKGWLLGIQFDELFTDDLYFKIAQKADRMAMKLRRGMEEKGYRFLMESWTNQQFPILPDEQIAKLRERFVFSDWERVDETHTAVRFCTSWATKEENVDLLLAAL